MIILTADQLISARSKIVAEWAAFIRLPRAFISWFARLGQPPTGSSPRARAHAPRTAATGSSSGQQQGSSKVKHASARAKASKKKTVNKTVPSAHSFAVPSAEPADEVTLPGSSDATSESEDSDIPLTDSQAFVSYGVIRDHTGRLFLCSPWLTAAVEAVGTYFQSRQRPQRKMRLGPTGGQQILLLVLMLPMAQGSAKQDMACHAEKHQANHCSPLCMMPPTAHAASIRWLQACPPQQQPRPPGVMQSTPATHCQLLGSLPQRGRPLPLQASSDVPQAGKEVPSVDTSAPGPQLGAQRSSLDNQQLERADGDGVCSQRAPMAAQPPTTQHMQSETYKAKQTKQGLSTRPQPKHLAWASWATSSKALVTP